MISQCGIRLKPPKNLPKFKQHLELKEENKEYLFWIVLTV